MNKAAGTVVFNEDRTRVLLCKREDFRIWMHPGGKVEDGESVEDAAVRETLEETGYRVVTSRLIGKYFHPQMPDGGILLHLFEAHVIGGVPTKCFETVDLGFFPLNALPRRTDRWTRTHIEDALSVSNQVIERTETLPLPTAVLIRVGIALRDFRNKYILRHE